MDERFSETGRVAEGLTELAMLLLAVEDVNEALSHLAQIAVAVIPDGPSCGITVMRDGQPVTAAYAGSVPAWVDEAQYERGDGPCLQALRTGSVVVAQDLAAEERWGDWPAVALGARVHGVYAHPLEIDGAVVGALTLYAHEPGLFPEDVQRVAMQFVGPAGMLLGGVLRRLSQADVIAQLQAALSSRATIDQAIGVIMARRRCGAEEAFRVLRKMSNDRNIKLHEIAATLVRSLTEGGQGPAGQ